MLSKILCLAAVLFFLGNAMAEDSATSTVLPTRPLPSVAKIISLDEASKLLEENPNVAVLDVRWLEEYKTLGHLPRAISLDMFRTDFAEGLASLELDKNKPCLVYCAIGGRSKRAAEKMAALGYRDIRILEGGFSAWKKAGRPIDGGVNK